MGLSSFPSFSLSIFLFFFHFQYLTISSFDIPMLDPDLISDPSAFSATNAFFDG